MTSSQWLDLAVLAVAFVAAISGWHSGALGSLLSFVGVVLGAVAGVLLAPHVVEPYRRRAHQAVRHAVLDPRPGGDRRDRGRGAGPRGARRHPQPHAAILRLGDRRGPAAGRGAGGGVAVGLPPDVVRSAQPGRRGAGLQGGRAGRQGGAGLAEVGTESAVGAVGHLRPARCAAAVRRHPDRRPSTPRTPRWPATPSSP